ncbi:TonB-dependent receptor [Sphingobium sp. H39-3-25]|uniref:TonB-dependent receptor plug domain-containing protein n=1 Tax=Sphingobium arseniciresistens TaxID=3030834 RepID=UPI0023B94872|nr:TonB-dependent receptor [Sphingobium arseniciresistens]
MKNFSILATASVIAFAAALPAHAQSEAPLNPQPVPQSAQSATVEDIIVTGSRIARPGFEAPTPVTAVQTSDLARQAPGAIADGLNQLPQFQNSINTQSRATSTGGAQNTGNYLNMRALGPNRVLVLQDGLRMPVSGNNGGVDISLVPSMLIERVEVVTGGASAIYGSDAVSGVVNFILDKHLTGLKGLAQGGIATNGHFPSYRLGLAGGVSLMDDRLHIVASAERYYTAPLDRRYLPIIGQTWSLNGNGTAGSPFAAINGTRTTLLSNQGIVASGPLAGQFNANGDIVPLNLGTPTSVPGISIGGDGGIFDQLNGTTASSQLMNQFFVRPEYDFGSGIIGFVSVGYNTSKYKGNPGALFVRQIRIFNDNAYLKPAQVAALGSTSSFDVGRIFTEGPQHDVTQKSDSLVINAGLKGNLGGSFKWDIGYSHSKTDFYSGQRDIQFSKFYASVDAVRDPVSGNIVCRPTLDPDPAIRARYASCAPLNIFGNNGTNAAKEAAYDYFWDTSFFKTKNKMDSIQATLTGDLFKLPAGAVSFALGAEYRHVSIDQTSNGDPSIAIDFTGLRGVLSNQRTKFRLNNNGVGNGSQNVKEIFGELDVPVLKDSGIGSLDLNGGIRLTDYSTSGRVTTWKVGSVFEPLEGLRFRGSYSRDIRAPTLFELFSAQQNSSQSFFDQLTGRNATLQIVSGGNAALKPEIAKTLTLGVVLRPVFLQGLSFSMDYYNIDIKAAISSPFTAQQILDNCAISNYTAPVCDNVVRPISATDPSPGNFPTAILVTNANLASQLVRGIDYELAYAFDLGGGRVSVRALATQVLKFNQQNAAGQPVRALAGTADFATTPLPKWRGVFDVTYVSGGFTAGIQERYIGSFDRSHVQYYVANHVPSIVYTDMNVSYKIPNKFGEVEMFAVVNNLLDTHPPITPAQQTAPGLFTPYYVNTYSPIGRTVTVGVRFKL